MRPRISISLTGLAIVGWLAAAPCFAYDLEVIAQDLRTHSAAAKTEGSAGMRDIAAGDTASGCAHLRTSEAEIQSVRALLEKMRDEVAVDGKGTQAEDMMQWQRIDAMSAAWLTTLSQVQGNIAKYCG